jgi:hypothetical protein
MKSLYLVVATATISSSISALLWKQSSKDLRVESITLAAQGGREVRISATKDGLEIRSPDSMGSVQLIFAGEGNLSFRMIAQDSLFDVGVGGVPVITLKNKGDKGGLASTFVVHAHQTSSLPTLPLTRVKGVQRTSQPTQERIQRHRAEVALFA